MYNADGSLVIEILSNRERRFNNFRILASLLRRSPHEILRYIKPFTRHIPGEKFIYLTTIGRVTGNDHAVELWFARSKEKIFLSHEGEYTDWMKNIKKNPNVEFKIGKKISAGKARIINNSNEFEEGKHVLYEKYFGKPSKEEIDDWFSLSKIIEITPEQDVSTK